MNRPPLIGVVGSGRPSPRGERWSREVGRLLARAGATVLCGGLGGVMEAAALGAKEAGGMSVGLLPGPDPAAANPHLTVALATGMGETRNALIARAAQGLVAVEGELGTLSEMALGLKMGKPVVALASPWELPGLVSAADPQEAVKKLLSLLNL